jgi:hypothetical protein
MSPATSRVALALLVVGVVLLPGPAYAIGLDRLDGPDRHRISTGYVATPIDASNDSLLAERYAGRLALRTESLQYRHVATDYRAPNRTRQVLERAIRNGTATAETSAVRSDLRRLARNETFLTVDDDAYYALSVSSGTVETSRATDAEIAAAVRDELVVDYGRLPAAERRTFGKIRNTTISSERGDYRPWSDEPVPDEPIVERDGTHYAVHVRSHTDDFGFPDGLLVGVAASLVGVTSLLGSGVVWLYGRYRD